MVKFFCDRCRAEVENLDALLEFSIEVNERPNRSMWSWRAEVCQDCCETLKGEIHQHIVAPPPTSEENRKKPTRKAAS